MSQRFTILEADTWHDEHFMALSSDARLLFIWAFTNPRAATSGLWAPCSLRSLQQGLGASDGPGWASKDRVVHVLEELALKPMLAYDYGAELAWVVTRVEHVLRRTRDKARAMEVMRREFAAAPPCRLRDEFALRYPEVARAEL